MTKTSATKAKPKNTNGALVSSKVKSVKPGNRRTNTHLEHKSLKQSNRGTNTLNEHKSLSMPSEHRAQANFMSYLSFNWPEVLAFAVPNGGSRHALEAIKLKAEGVLAGVPDIYVEEARGGYFGLRLEFKKEMEKRKIGGGVSSDQLIIHNKLRDRGYHVRVVYGQAHAKEVFRAYMVLGPTRIQPDLTDAMVDPRLGMLPAWLQPPV